MAKKKSRIATATDDIVVRGLEKIAPLIGVESGMAVRDWIADGLPVRKMRGQWTAEPELLREWFRKQIQERL